MNYHQVENYVVRDEDGYIAVIHRNSNPTAYTTSPDKITYHWTPQHGVSLSWINPQHLLQVLGEDARICCGKTGKKFFVASYTAVRVWETGDR